MPKTQRLQATPRKRDRGVARRVENQRANQDKALSLWLDGKNWPDIAKECGYANGHSAYRAGQSAMARRAEQRNDLRDRAIDTTMAQLERLQQAYYPKALEGDHASLDSFLKITGRSMQFLALTAPKIGPDEAGINVSLEKTVNVIVRAMESGDLPADITNGAVITQQPQVEG